MHLNTIIIPTFNNFQLTRKCILSIFRNSNFFKFEVIIVDNGSTDDTLTWAKIFQDKGLIRIIENNCNLGYAHACNQGALSAKGKFIILLNNDTEVLPGWLQGLHNCLNSDKNIGIVGGKLLYPDNTIQHAGIAFDSQTVSHIYRHFHPLHPAVNKKREFQAVTGACLFIRRELFITLGMFDEEFINGFEDLDFCFRARKNGFKAFYTPECNVIHHESMTPGRHAHHDRNARLFTSRWQPDIVQDMDTIHAEDGLCRLAAYENAFGGNWYEDSNPNPFWEKARFLAANGNHAEGMAVYGQALSFNPYDIRRLAMTEELGDLYTLMGRFADAAQCYDAVLRFQPSYLLRNKIAGIGKASMLPSCRHR